MRKLSFYCLIPLAVFAVPAIGAEPEQTGAIAPSQHASFTNVQARFASLQNIARPDDLPFELRIVDAGQSLFGQRGDGVVRLPEDLITAAPDSETLDFLMLMGLSDATMRDPEPQGLDKTTEVAAWALGWIANSVSETRAGRGLPVWSAPHFESDAPPHFASNTPSRANVSALRALRWTTATGGCEARVIAGLRKLESSKVPSSQDSRHIVKALGAVAWTPDDRCGPPPG